MSEVRFFQLDVFQRLTRWTTIIMPFVLLAYLYAWYRQPSDALLRVLWAQLALALGAAYCGYWLPRTRLLEGFRIFCGVTVVLLVVLGTSLPGDLWVVGPLALLLVMLVATLTDFELRFGWFLACTIFALLNLRLKPGVAVSEFDFGPFDVVLPYISLAIIFGMTSAAAQLAVAQLRKTSGEVEDLARFPDENPNAVIRIAREGTVLYGNQQARRTILPGLGTAVGEKVPGELHDTLLHILEEGVFVETNHEIGGRTYHCGFMPVPKQDYVNLYAVDITDQLEAEHALLQAQEELIQAEKLAGLGTVAAGVAHEIRNPLQAVLALSESMAEDDDLERIHADAQEAVTASQRIASIIDDLTGYSRDARRTTVSTVSLNDAVETALSMAHHTRRLSSLEIESDLQSSASVMANSAELTQVVSNLINNAADAMAEGGKLTLSTRDSDGFAWLSVSDTGPGIDAETQRRLFEPFFTTKPPGEGTGLGLYVTQKIIDKHQGVLELESAPGKGATFSVRFPQQND